MLRERPRVVARAASRAAGASDGVPLKPSLLQNNTSLPSSWQSHEPLLAQTSPDPRALWEGLRPALHAHLVQRSASPHIFERGRSATQ